MLLVTYYNKFVAWNYSFINKWPELYLYATWASVTLTIYSIYRANGTDDWMSVLFVDCLVDWLISRLSGCLLISPKWTSPSCFIRLSDPSQSVCMRLSHLSVLDLTSFTLKLVIMQRQNTVFHKSEGICKHCHLHNWENKYHFDLICE